MKKRNDLCNYYILPLLKLNKSSFGLTNFVNSWLSVDLEHVIVETHIGVSHPETHENYLTDYSTENDHVLIIYKLPEKWKQTAEQFKAGKYSQFSQEAKSLIKLKSGLNYKKPDGKGNVRSARELLALDRDPDLKKLIEDEIGVKLPADAELVSSPYEEDFYNLKLERVCQGS